MNNAGCGGAGDKIKGFRGLKGSKVPAGELKDGFFVAAVTGKRTAASLCGRQDHRAACMTEKLNGGMVYVPECSFRNAAGEERHPAFFPAVGREKARALSFRRGSGRKNCGDFFKLPAQRREIRETGDKAQKPGAAEEQQRF